MGSILGSDYTNILTTLGVSDNDTNMGTFIGVTIQDNVSTKQALQDLETALEAISSVSISNDANDRIVTALGNGNLNAEANFTFDGTETATITGTNPSFIFSTDGTASDGGLIRFYNTGASQQVEAQIAVTSNGSNQSSINISNRVSSDTAGALTSRFYIAEDGNIGIGTTDIEAWDSGFSVVNLNNGILYSNGTNIALASNLYYSSGWKYEGPANGAASLLQVTPTEIGSWVVESGAADATAGIYRALQIRTLDGLYTKKAKFTAAVTLAAGDFCYLNSSSKMALVDADAQATSQGLLAICTEAITADNTGQFIIEGVWTTTGLTAGSEYWLHTTAGDITTTQPAGTGDIVRSVGYALSTTELWFKPSNTFIEVS